MIVLVASAFAMGGCRSTPDAEVAAIVDDSPATQNDNPSVPTDVIPSDPTPSDPQEPLPPADGNTGGGEPLPPAGGGTGGDGEPLPPTDVSDDPAQPPTGGDDVAGDPTTDGDTDEPLPPTTGTIWLSWRAPSEREDGSALALADLGGYRIYYGPTGNAKANTVTVSDPSVTSYQLNGVAVGTYQVAVSAVDRDGLESVLSNSLSKSVQ